jgi:hypothetical protein
MAIRPRGVERGLSRLGGPCGTNRVETLELARFQRTHSFVKHHDKDLQAYVRDFEPEVVETKWGDSVYELTLLEVVPSGADV